MYEYAHFSFVCVYVYVCVQASHSQQELEKVREVQAAGNRQHVSLQCQVETQQKGLSEVEAVKNVLETRVSQSENRTRILMVIKYEFASPISIFIKMRDGKLDAMRCYVCITML